MDKTLNEKLLDEQKYWVDNILRQYVTEKNPSFTYDGDDIKKKLKKQKISHPFYMGLSSEYINCNDDRKKIMIVGQEALGYGEIDDGTAYYNFINSANKSNNAPKLVNEPNYSQHWTIAYIEKQIYGINSDFDIKINSSPFWNFFRALKEKNYVLCWNNLDKVYFGKQLSYTAEKELSKQYKRDGETDKKSLLQREIALAKPDAVLFITGPYYDVSMKIAFCPDNDILSANKPEPHNRLIDITDIIQIKSDENKLLPSFWTYHPNYLIRHKTINKIVDKIDEELNKTQN